MQYRNKAKCKMSLSINTSMPALLSSSWSCGFGSAARLVSEASSKSIFQSSYRLCITCRVSVATRANYGVAGDSSSEQSIAETRTNYSGIKLDEIVHVDARKLRLDAWISSRISGISRARVQSSIRSGLVRVNGRIVDKASHKVKAGDEINCTISELQPLRAEPESIPLDIVYEDKHVLVVNKPAHMVVHPAPGNRSGTLVNAVLNHCNLPNAAFTGEEALSESDDLSDDEVSIDPSCVSPEELNIGPSLRPGIVHRLDKGTSGLLVMAKDEHSHSHLSEQFKLRTIKRVYVSLTTGVPVYLTGRVDVPVGRDPNNRIRMTTVTGSVKCGKARHAASRYKVKEVLAGGAAALVEWRLETGRTHQIRAHAKYLGIPLLGDDLYGATECMALSLLRPKTPARLLGETIELVSRLERPCLHALALGFRHPYTGEHLYFSSQPPLDFEKILFQLRRIGTEK